MTNNKILLIIPTLGLGGAEIMVENLALTLKDRDYYVKVISLYNYQSPITIRLENANIPIIYLNKKTGFDFKIVLQLYKIFKAEKPSVVHTHLYSLPYAFIAAKSAKVNKVVHTIHSMADKEVTKNKRKINKILYKKFGVIPVAISPIVKESIIEEYQIEPSMVPMIFNGIDLDKCIEKDNYFLKDKFTILHIGSFTKPKNHEGLINSFKSVHDIYAKTELMLIGKGELEDEIKKQVNTLELDSCVKFMGLQADVHLYLNEADIFVLPSLWEGMPITLIEAMATGLPIVATGVGGVPDMIKSNASGLLVNTNTKEISDAIIQLINDESLRERLGRETRKEAAKFSSQNMAMQYTELYEK